MISHDEQVDELLDKMGIKDPTIRGEYKEKWKEQISEITSYSLPSNNGRMGNVYEKR